MGLELIFDPDQLKESGLYLMLWRKELDPEAPKLSSYYRDVSEAQTAAENMAKEGANIYFGPGLSKTRTKERNRVKAEKVAAIPGLWVDLDYGSRDSNGKNYPKNRNAALKILDSAYMKPSLIIRTGGGLHAYWLFHELWVFDNAEERKQAHNTSYYWQKAIHEIVRKAGHVMDSTHDLSRVLRPPKTYNYNYDDDHPKMVRVEEQNDYRYNPSDFEQFVHMLAAGEGDGEKEEADTAVLPDGLDLHEPEGDGKDLLEPLDLQEQALYQNSLNDLLVEDAVFKKTYRRLRKDLADQSFSSYDAALARRAVDAGFPDRWIVSLINAFRIQHSGTAKDRNKGQRRDYLERTIRFARENAEVSEGDAETVHRINDLNIQAEDLYKDINTGKKAEVDVEKELAQVQRQLLDTVSSRFEVDILAVKRYLFEPDPEFELITDQGAFHLGKVENLIEQKMFARKVAAYLKIQIAEVSKENWRKYTQAMLNACVDVQMPSSATEVGQVDEWIANYLEAYPRTPTDLSRAVARRAPYRRKDGTYLILVDGLLEWLQMQGVRVQKKLLQRALQRAGFQCQRTTYKKEDNRPTSIQGYIVDPNMLGKEGPAFLTEEDEEKGNGK